MQDVTIIGGGIVGLSVAWQLKSSAPGLRILLLERESRPAMHQSSHNSGVIHAGIYYEPGSRKSTFCRQGATQMLGFCRRYNIPFEQCGKLLVATDRTEQDRMQALFERAQTLGLQTDLLDAHALTQLEPAISGVAAIRVRDTAIVNYADVANTMAALFREAGGEIRCNAAVEHIDEQDAQINLRLATGETIQSRYVVACAGLWADRIAKMTGLPIDFRIVPFRGEYFRLPAAMNTIIRHLIYPIPDPALPFLGIHLTRMIDGHVTVGPNAVLAFNRDVQSNASINLGDTLDNARFVGFWRLLRRHAASGLVEFRNSLWKPGYLAQVQKYCPSIALGDLGPYPAGIRAQAVTRSGELVHDFLFAESARSLHVCNAPSPAATSSIPIGDHVCKRLMEKIEHG